MLNKFCDGIKRRDFLRAGVVGSGLMSGLGLNLASYLRMAQAGELGAAKATRAIYIRLGGGPTHMDTFDLKPDAPSEYRGEFKPISTNVAGHPNQRAPAQARPVRRQVHAAARRQPHAGRARIGHQVHEHGQPAAPLVGISRASAPWSARNCRTADDLPPFVAIPNTPQIGRIFWASSTAPFNTNNTPEAGEAVPRARHFARPRD